MGDLDFQVLSLAPHNSWENFVVEISGLSDCRKLTVGNVYRPPGDLAVNMTCFIDEFSCLHRSVVREVIVAGDYNADLLKFDHKPLNRDIFLSLCANNFLPKITHPTRITSHSATLIDSFYCKFSPLVSSAICRILYHRLADHQPYVLSLSLAYRRATPQKFADIRKRSAEAIQHFIAEIGLNVEGQSLPTSTDSDPNFNFDIFHDIVTRLISHG